MGREIRRVIPNWEHPRRECPHSPYSGGREEAKKNGGQCFLPFYDHDFETVARKWREGFVAWENGDRQSYLSESGKDLEFWEAEGGPPDREYCRPKWTEEEATWFQMYETVSQGTPVTPPFATKEELVDYLVANGDYWDQHGFAGGWPRENAISFVERGSSPSFIVVTNTRGRAEIKEPRDGI